MPISRTVINRGIKPVGRYQSSILSIPLGDTHFSAFIRRPNVISGETPWPMMGTGGNPEVARENNGSIEFACGGNDIQVARVFFYLSEDGGLTWIPAGYFGTKGGNSQLKGGDLALVSGCRYQLPDFTNPDRRLMAVLRCREEIDTNLLISTDVSPIPRVITRDTHNTLTVDSSSTIGAAFTADSVASGTVTPANSRRYLVAFGSNGDDPTPSDVVSTVFNGAETMTTVTNNVNGYNRMVGAELTNPTATGATVTYTVAATNAYHILCGAVAFQDANQTTPSDTPSTVSTGTGSDPSNTVNAGDSVDMRIACATGNDVATSVVDDANQTSRATLVGSGNYNAYMAISTKNAGESDNSFGWNTTGDATEWIARGWNINEDLGGAAATNFYPTIHQYLRMMRG